MERITEASLLFKARTAGACWLMTILAGIFVVIVVLKGAHYLSVFTVERLKAMTLMFLKVGGQANDGKSRQA